MRETSLAGEILVCTEFMIGAGVVLSQGLDPVRHLGGSEKAPLFRLLVGVGGQPQQDLLCQSVIGARVETEIKFQCCNVFQGFSFHMSKCGMMDELP